MNEIPKFKNTVSEKDPNHTSEHNGLNGLSFDDFLNMFCFHIVRIVVPYLVGVPTYKQKSAIEICIKILLVFLLSVAKHNHPLREILTRLNERKEFWEKLVFII